MDDSVPLIPADPPAWEGIPLRAFIYLFFIIIMALSEAFGTGVLSKVRGATGVGGGISGEVTATGEVVRSIFIVVMFALSVYAMKVKVL